MQMYRVKIIREYDKSTSMVDALVCAGNAEAAGRLAMYVVEWPVSQCRVSAERVKPSYYEIHRRAKPDNDTAPAARADSDEAPSWWTLQASMMVKARTEKGAMMAASKAFDADAKSNSLPNSVREFEVNCAVAPHAPRPPAIETQAIFSHVQFFQGGAARGK